MRLVINETIDINNIQYLLSPKHCKHFDALKYRKVEQKQETTN